MSEDEQAAAAQAQADDPAARTKQWLLSTSSGALATLSCESGIEGFPFGSVVPFQLTAEGAPYVLVADIAAHTRNLKKDPRASLLVQEQGIGDPQSRWRVTLIGAMQRLVAPGDPDRRDDDVELPERALAELHARYRARVPAADEYTTTHGFRLWRMDVRRVRYIAGFGKICWIDPQAVRMDPDLGAAAPGAVAHMNDDHTDAMKDLAHAAFGARPDGARMLTLEKTGFLVETTGPRPAGARLLWCPFGKEITPGEIRHEVVLLVKAARR